jgi:IclR family transcriptional regulator, KDG regulon repressor
MADRNAKNGNSEIAQNAASSVSSTVQKAFSCLKALADLGGSASASEVATRVGISRAGASRLLETMVSSGALVWDNQSRRYCFGLSFYEWGGLAPQSRRLMPIMRREAVQLAAELERRVDVLVAEFPYILHMELYEFVDGVVITSPVQHRVPWWRTTSGMVIVSFASPDEVENRIASSREATESPLLTEDEMRSQIREIREKGYALSAGNFKRTIGVVVPVFDSSEFAVATISVPSTQEDFTEANQLQWLARAQDAAFRASSQLGSRRRSISGIV